MRPKGSFEPLEQQQALVRSNYLSGVFGGITYQQWRQVLHIPGVEVAAPIENVGYIIPEATITIPIGRYIGGEADQLYRLRTEWLANNGLSKYPGAVPYIYIAAKRGECQSVGFGQPENPSSPFALENAANAYLASCVVRNGQSRPGGRGPVAQVDALFPILIAAIDPTQENRLLHLDRTIVHGRPLSEVETYSTTDLGSVVPVIASARTYVDQSLRVTIERVSRPPAGFQGLLSSTKAYRGVRRLPGRVVGQQSYTATAMYRGALRQLEHATVPYLADFWTVSNVSYQLGSTGALVPRPVKPDPAEVWSDPVGFGGFYQPPPGNQDVQFRSVGVHSVVLNRIQAGDGMVQVVGRFDPTKLPGFSPLSQLPLESYYPPVALPANSSSRRALGNRPLYPTMNLGGYIAQPPFMLTTIQAARGFVDPKFFKGANWKAPISVIRVRVAGVTGPDRLSLARIRQVAQLIQQRTGLAVDITAGSSPTPMLVELPAGKFGQPPLLVREGWVKRGVAVVLLSALDRKSLALFFLVLVVTALFLVNGALASVRARRTEVGTLLALGWTRRKIYEAVLGELTMIGLAAGLLGTGVAASLVWALRLRMPVVHTLLVAPVAVLLASMAGIVPARRAARGAPLDAVHPPLAEGGRHAPVRGLARMAAVNLQRVPGRTVLAAAGLFVGVGALTVLLSIDLAFRGTLVGTALGRVISVQVRGVDLLGVVLAILLGAVSVADVVFLNIRERAPELVTLGASGWGDGQLGGLVTLEGLGVGILGSVLGAAAGLSLSLFLGGAGAKLALAGLLAVASGTGVALLSSLVPASLISRLAPPSVLAEE